MQLWGGLTPPDPPPLFRTLVRPKESGYSTNVYIDLCLWYRTRMYRRGYEMKGGVKKTFTSTHTPLDIACVTSSTLRTMDIACVTSSTLRKIYKHPSLDIHKHHHPLGHCPCDIINIPWGGGDLPVTHTLHRFSVSGQDKIKGGGRSPWIRHCYTYDMYTNMY